MTTDKQVHVTPSGMYLTLNPGDLVKLSTLNCETLYWSAESMIKIVNASEGQREVIAELVEALKLVDGIHDHSMMGAIRRKQHRESLIAKATALQEKGGK